MIAGKMKYKLLLLKPTRLVDSMGAEVTTYEETRKVHAERVKASGARSEEVGEHFANYSVEYNIRSAHPVAEGWRVQQIGGYLYTVDAIIPNIDRGFITLKCERVNE